MQCDLSAHAQIKQRLNRALDGEWLAFAQEVSDDLAAEPPLHQSTVWQQFDGAVLEHRLAAAAKNGQANSLRDAKDLCVCPSCHSLARDQRKD